MPKSRYIYLILICILMLIAVIVLRPWAGPQQRKVYQQPSPTEGAGHPPRPDDPQRGATDVLSAEGPDNAPDSAANEPSEPKGTKVQVKPEPLVTENGFFFYEGEYFPTPYEITSDKNGVYVNGVRVIPYAPVAERQELKVPDEDPGPFQWTPQLVEKGDFSYMGFIPHAQARFLYWQQKFGREKAESMLVKYLQEQPVVREAWIADVLGAMVTFKKGGGNGFELPTPGRRALEQDKLIEKDAVSMYESLAKGRGVLILDAARISLSERKVLLVCGILLGEGTVEEQTRSLKKIIPPAEAVTLAKRFKGAGPLKKRIEGLGAR